MRIFNEDLADVASREHEEELFGVDRPFHNYHNRALVEDLKRVRVVAEADDLPAHSQ